MIRARQTLTLARFPGPHSLLDVLMDEPSVLLRNGPAPPSTPPPELSRRYRRLGLRDVFLSYAGYRGTNNPVHQAMAELSAGDILQVRANRRDLVDRGGTARRGFRGTRGHAVSLCTGLGHCRMDRQYSEPQYQERITCDSWEVVVPELVFEPDS